MITYADLTHFAPPASTKEERDEWFRDHGYDPDDLLRVGLEVAEWRLADLEDGAMLTADTLRQALVLASLFGFELALRCERDDRPDLTPPSDEDGAS